MNRPHATHQQQMTCATKSSVGCHRQYHATRHLMTSSTTTLGRVKCAFQPIHIEWPQHQENEVQSVKIVRDVNPHLGKTAHGFHMPQPCNPVDLGVYVKQGQSTKRFTFVFAYLISIQSHLLPFYRLIEGLPMLSVCCSRLGQIAFDWSVATRPA